MADEATRTVTISLPEWMLTEIEEMVEIASFNLAVDPLRPGTPAPRSQAVHDLIRQLLREALDQRARVWRQG
jgi:Arc/MetJ-type ribon-helix-helix transcriptional regulator